MAYSYDEIPYDSQPIRETHPENLALQATLLGLRPAPPERCRVLELGCATGGNLIPMAYHLPESEFVGVELSAVQVATAQRLRAALGLRNLHIEQADLATLDPEAYGSFDYIIAHGLYSWVGPAVRTKLLALCARALAPQGIAYVSYNTLPGWHLRAVLREALLYGVRSETTAAARLARARWLLEQLERIYAAHDDPIAQHLGKEIATLRGRDASYLYHEYLEEVNAPVLFSEFMAEAERHGLQYLCETQLQTMFPEPLGEAAVALVDSFEELIAQEQIMDFLRLRTFRQTLLCRAGIEIRRELDLQQFASFAYYALLTPCEPLDLAQCRPQPFTTPEGHTCYVSHPLTKLALVALAESYPDALAFADLSAMARARALSAGSPHAPEAAQLLGELTGLYLRQYVGVSPSPRHYFRELTPRPCATALARASAASGLGHVATAWHMPMGLDAFAARLLAGLDGRRTQNELVRWLLEEIAAGRLVLEDPLPAAEAERRAAVADNCARLLAAFARHGLLQPPTAAEEKQTAATGGASAVGSGLQP